MGEKQRYSQDATLVPNEEALLPAMGWAAELVVSTLPLDGCKAGCGNVSNANKQWVRSDNIQMLKLALFYVSDSPPALQQ